MSKDLNTIFSTNLRRLLEEHEKTQADLYRYMGVSSAIASAWCTGKKIPRGDKLQKMCAWFHCDLSDLLEEKASTAQIPKEDNTTRLVKSLNDNPDDLQLCEDIIKLDDEKKEMVARLTRYLNGE